MSWLSIDGDMEVDSVAILDGEDVVGATVGCDVWRRAVGGSLTGEELGSGVTGAAVEGSDTGDAVGGLVTGAEVGPGDGLDVTGVVVGDAVGAPHSTLHEHGQEETRSTISWKLKPMP